MISLIEERSYERGMARDKLLMQFPARGQCI
jgi:hypothetical protein